MVENEEEDTNDDDTEEDPHTDRRNTLLLNDEQEEAIMQGLMKKSTEMFGTRKSISSLFMLRRSTKTKPEEVKSAWTAEKMAPLPTQPDRAEEPLKVVDIQNDVEDILGKQQASPQESPFDTAKASPETKPDQEVVQQQPVVE